VDRNRVRGIREDILEDVDELSYLWSLCRSQYQNQARKIVASPGREEYRVRVEEERRSITVWERIGRRRSERRGRRDSFVRDGYVTERGM